MKINLQQSLFVILIFLLSNPLLFAQKNKKRKEKTQETQQFLSEEDYKGLKFRNIGPFRGGRSVAVAGTVQDRMTYYMGSTGGGMWKTTDAGITWKNISDGFFKTGSVGAVAVAESDENVIYVGMGEHAVRGVMTSHGDGIYKSTDAGRTWKNIGLTATKHISDVIIHPQNPDIVYVSAQGTVHGPSKERGIYRTMNGGDSWEKVLYVDDNTGASGLSMDMNNPRILYAATWEHRRYPWEVKSGGEGSRIYKSVDAGETWEQLTEGLPEMMGKIGISVSRANSDLVFANIEAEEGGVYRSEDAGKTWMHICKERVTQARSWYYMEIFTDPLNEDVVYVMNAPFLKSIDRGKTFRPVAVPHGDNHDLWVNPQDNNIMINANDGGANISFNGGKSWSTQKNQPTSQFYRVITDNRFPYYVYGGQQDNSTVAIVSRTTGGGIGWKDWYAVAGGESAFLAFDENDPQLVYGGSYQGNISVFDHKTSLRKDLMAYPVVGLGTVPKEMKYRFNWNAPIIVSSHDGKTLYHTANKVLKSTNGGQEWKEISPDLTRNDTTKQGYGGGPFTNEGAGGENYNTIAYLAESPHDANELWSGSDCGLVYMTNDGGKNWNNVTPPNLQEGIINSIEISPHAASRVIITFMRYKFNDFKPYAYLTEDSGKSWTLINNGFEDEAFVRVIREDQKREGIFYAGTELGMYVSENLGKSWKPFQLNLPICPINDIALRQNDMVVATSGRGFWILDDLGAIQQHEKIASNNSIQLFVPKPTVKLDAPISPEPIPGLGQNPLNGVIIDYYLSQEIETSDSALLLLEILDENGEVIRTYDNQKDLAFVPYEGGPMAKQLLPTKQGINRFAWDFRRGAIPNVPDVFVMGDYRGHLVAPGQYTIRITLDSISKSVPCEILPDPRLDVSKQDFANQQEILLQIENYVKDIHGSVNSMRSAKEQLAFMSKILKEEEGMEVLLDSGNALVEKINQWEENLIQPKQKTFQDVINFPNQLNAELLNLKSRVDTHDPRVTKGASLRLKDLAAEWDVHKKAMREIIDVEVAEFNKMYQEKNLPALILNLENNASPLNEGGK